MKKLAISRGEGCRVFDEDGKEYLDFTSGGIFQCPFGIQDEGALEAMIYGPYATYSHHYDNRVTLRFIDRLKEWSGYESVALFCEGSVAAEAYWRALRIYTGKPHVWGGLVDPDDVGKDDAKPDAMHGSTLGALIMSGRMTWHGMDPSGSFAGRYAQSHVSTGCAIWEPYHAPSGQFHKQKTVDHVKSMIKEFPDIPHCSDEIQGGMGRTGRRFGYEWYDGLKPEFVLLGKMLGGGLPLSALLGPKEIMEDRAVVKEASLHSTHGGYPLGSSVGCYVLDRIMNEDLVGHSQKMGLVMDKELSKLQDRHHSGRGLLAGIEFDSPTRSTLVTEACRRRGLLVVDTGRKWIKLGPQLTITEGEIIEGCAILKSAIEEVQHDLEACGNTSGEPIKSGELVQ